MKKLLSFVLSVAFLVSLSSPVLATGVAENAEVYVATSDKAIIIIPGLAGTALRTSSGTTVWYSSSNSALAACTENGTSVYNIEPIATGSTQYGIYNMYATLYDALDEAFGSTYDVRFFPYDWRMSNADSAEELETFINNLGYDEVVLVAHSMGGLVASSYLCSSTNRAKVDKLITLGTPYLGSPAILNALETGEFLPETLGYPDEDFAELIKNYPSVYQTLPPSSSFESYVVVDGELLFSFSETNGFLKTLSWAKRENSSNYKPMFDTAVNFHNSLIINQTSVTNLSDVEVYRLYGLGQETIDRVEYDSSGNYMGVIINTLGDGTVPYFSAKNGLSTKPRKNFNVDHNDLVTDSTVIGFIVECINGTASFSASDEIEANDRGWLIGEDNKRITVRVDGSDSFLDILDSTIIHTSTGEQVIRDKNKLYVKQNDGTVKEVGTVWKVGNEAFQLSMRNDSYTFNFTTLPEVIVVEYSDGGYYERVLNYNLSDASSARLTVSNYDTKDVQCIKFAVGNVATYSFESVDAYELPEDQLYDYKNPNK